MLRDLFTDQVAELFQTKGASQYGGEAVTQQEHALQAALLAEQGGAGAPLIAAALLHDIGHLLHDLPDDAPDAGIDDVHERRGHAWLRDYCIPDVTEPVRLHVDAKRYLCAVDAMYLQTLSPPSIQSLEMQGGKFTEAEARRFEQHPYFRSSILLRRWDDCAKTPRLPTPGLEHYLALLAEVQYASPAVGINP